MPDPGRESAGEFRWRTAVLVTVASAAAVLALVEAVSRSLLAGRYYVWPPGFATRLDPEPGIIHGVKFPADLTINSVGMRGDEPSASASYHVLAIGGSTTICVYLDDANAWPQRVQERINRKRGADTIWVGNVGRPGHTTAQHVLQVERLLPQHPEVDAVVLLVGINDLLIYLALTSPLTAGGPLHVARPEDVAFSISPGWDEGAPWYARNFVGRLARLSRWNPVEDAVGLQPMGPKGKFVKVVRGYRRRAGAMRQELPDLGDAIRGYESGLRQIVDAARGADVRPILLTQPVLWREGLSPAEQELLWLGGPPLDRLHDGATYFTAGALADGMGRYNAALLRVCREQGVECLDLAERMPRTSELFYDDAHFTDAGAERVAELVASFLLERAPLQAPGPRSGAGAVSRGSPGSAS